MSMIKNIHGNEFIYVNETYTPERWYPNYNPDAGAVKFNASCGEFEVFDGYIWRRCSSTVTLNFSYEMQNIINWARLKMHEDQRLKELADKYPALKDAQNQLDVVKALVTKWEQEK